MVLEILSLFVNNIMLGPGFDKRQRSVNKQKDVRDQRDVTLQE